MSETEKDTRLFYRFCEDFVHRYFTPIFPKLQAFFATMVKNRDRGLWKFEEKDFSQNLYILRNMGFVEKTYEHSNEKPKPHRIRLVDLGAVDGYGKRNACRFP